ncbi:major histocompatibility complex class I-related gene protein-like isoform X1 [Gopherus flavomarginatus]|uniref:major histocompatibility complex class I-related gene protein-like isoform X1 n=1 Tax=Gopherus flavomarginatus TaxID=286002 RepID=UPI0021CBA168|nr:major histocompatibility complex class I-related gene protein-like isoform X1 [Gopherus flavomarginatus]
MGGPGSLLLLPILLLGGAESRSHSLQYFLTAVSESGPGVPEFTVAGYVDGQRFVEYDSEAQQMQARAPWMQETEPEVWERENRVHKVRQACFRGKVRSHMHLYNQSRGFHIFQYAYGCEIRADGSTGGFRRFGYDGGDFLIYDAARHRWEAPAREAEATQRRWNGDPVALQYYRHFLERECVEALRRYLQLGRGALARRERPAMRVTGRDAPDGPTTLCCRAHGFYPRDIALSWRRKGESREQETWRGGVLPNGDGTYHAWATVELDPRERGLYRCHVEHESLAQPLVVGWEPPSESLLVPVVAGVILALGAVAVLVGLAWRRRQSGPKADLYSPAPASEHGSDSSITGPRSCAW